MAFLELPQIDWKPVFELRERIERRQDFDFSETANDNRTALQSRFRIGADFKSGKNVSGQLRYQYAHDLNWTAKLNNSLDQSNLFLANVSFKTPKNLALTLGRQIISKGDKRILDVSEYSQRSKVFDGLRATSGAWDAFAGRVGMTSNVRDHSKLAFAAYKWAAGETIALYHTDTETLNLNDWTLNHRWTGSAGRANLAVEGALQRGKASGKTLNAFWAHARAQQKISKLGSVYVEGNVVSGGSSATETHLFDPLYGTSHTPYGLMDLQGLRNVRHLEIGYQHQAAKNLTALVSFNGYALYDPSDGWYNTGGTVNSRPGGRFIDPTGSKGRDIGRELNLGLAWKPNPAATLELQLGYFKPGHFIEAFNAGATTNGYWGLLSYSAKF